VVDIDVDVVAMDEQPARRLGAMMLDKEEGNREEIPVVSTAEASGTPSWREPRRGLPPGSLPTTSLAGARS